MEWVRGEVLGHGSFGTVNLAIPRKRSSQLPSLMAVKSCADCFSTTLKNEKEILDQVGFCHQIVRCFGDDYTVEDGGRFYNLLLEYASRGSMADQMNTNNGHLKESDVRRYTRSLLKGLRHIHAKGFVHCDIKLQNVLVFDNDEVKIADFGLAKKSGDEQLQSGEESRFQYRGTPLYMSPESVNDNEYESPCDIWALGCAVVEMMTGKPAWNHKQESNLFALLIRIGGGDELPIIPGELSEEGKDFLMRCFVKNPKKRWTAEMLLNHPFVVCVDDGGDGNEFVNLKGSEEISTSPRSPFSFPQWKSVQSSVTTSISYSSPSGNSKYDSLLSSRSCVLDRIRLLVCDETPNWSDSESWITVR